MKVIIAGGRNFENYQLLKFKCDEILKNIVVEEIVSGKATGADTLGERYAKERGYRVNPFQADWDKYGKSAGYKRNEAMANYADCLIAFWDGKSKGTGHMIDLARAKKIPIRIIKYA